MKVSENLSRLMQPNVIHGLIRKIRCSASNYIMSRAPLVFSHNCVRVRDLCAAFLSRYIYTGARDLTQPVD